MNLEGHLLALVLLPLVLLLMIGCGDDQACREEQENMVSTARHLGDINDDNNRSLSGSGALSDCNATDYLHYYAEDSGFFSSNRPTLDVKFEAPISTGESNDRDESPPKPEACVYVACWYGATELTACHVDGEGFQPVTSPDGYRGCCQMGSGKIELEYECDNALFSTVSDDDAEFFVHLCTDKRPKRETIGYTLRATF